jgi:CRISPR-associated protein Csm4
MKALVLDPETPFSDVPRSDTLFGAACWGIRHARGEEALEAFLAAFADGDPPFRLSSALPVLDAADPDPTYLFPKPLLPGAEPGDEPEPPEGREAWRDLAYLPKPVFEQFATGAWTRRDFVDRLASDDPVVVDGTRYVVPEPADAFLLPAGRVDNADTESGTGSEADDDQSAPADSPVPFQRGERLRNAVNRLTNSTEGQLFTEERVHFAADAGLAVLVRGDVAAVAEGLAVIQDRGIGGNRTVGNGQYTLDGVRDVDLPDPDARYACTLSLCIPRPEMLSDVADEGFYDLETRKGVVEHSHASPDGIWKRRVLALAEGSLLPALGRVGYNPVVADHFEHGVQQYGHAFPVGMRAVEA